MKLQPISPLVIEQNEKIVLQFGSVFNSAGWLKLFGESLKQYGIFNDDKQLIGAFHLYQTKLRGLKVFCNAPFTPHIALFANNPAQTSASVISFEKSLLSELAALIESLPYALITISLPFKYCDLQPFIWEKFKVIPGYTYRLNLNASEEVLLANLSSNKRRSLKKMSEENLRTELTKDFKLVKSLILQTFNRKEKRLNTSVLDKILFEFAMENNSFAFITYRNNEAVSAAFCIHDTTTAYYLMGGYDESNTHYAAGVSSIWNCILEAKRRGLNTFDFEGSMIKEVEQYFRDFGGELVPYYTINKAILPVEILLKFKRRAYF